MAIVQQKRFGRLFPFFSISIFGRWQNFGLNEESVRTVVSLAFLWQTANDGGLEEKSTLKNEEKYSGGESGDQCFRTKHNRNKWPMPFSQGQRNRNILLNRLNREDINRRDIQDFRYPFCLAPGRKKSWRDQERSPQGFSCPRREKVSLALFSPFSVSLSLQINT